MTVSLTSTESSKANPPTPNDMTTTETTPPSCNTTDVSSASTVLDKDDQTGVRESTSVVDVNVTPCGNQDDETEEETSTEYAGDDETNLVINSHSESDSKTLKTSNKRARDGDSECDDVDDGDASANECDVKKLKSHVDDQSAHKVASPVNIKDDSVLNKVNDSKAKSGTDDSTEDMLSEDVAELARFKAAKFIQERTKMACLLPTSADAESAKQPTNPTPVTNAHQTTSRKRKLTVKDILVSQRNRDVSNKQQRVPSTETPPSNINNVGLNQMFSGLSQILDPNPQMNDSNPLAAFTAALAAAAASSSGPSNGIVSQSENNLSPGLVSDSQSAYISTLASTLSSNSNPTAALALMASLSAMMQQNSNNKDNADTLNTLTNTSGSLESSLSNIANNNFTSPTADITNDEEDEEVGDRAGGSTAPLDFSRKNFETKDIAEKPSVKRKSRKKSNGFENEDETPLDLSVSNKRPDESVNGNTNKTDTTLSAMLSQMPVIDGANGGNFAAMAAAAAAAAASFSPNLLTRMAASMAPWSNYGMQNLKLGNDPSTATAAFAALFQQVNNANQNSPNKSTNSMSSTTPANLFQSFPDLYWNGKVSNKTSTTSPSFGVLNNCTSSISSRHHHHPPPPAASQPMRTKSSSGRQNPWQAQWINRSSEQTRDVFTCVWCKESFKSLAEMTDHMKRSPRCGMAGMQQHHSHHHNHGQSTVHHTQQPGSGATQQPSSKITLSSPMNCSSSSTNKDTSNQSNPTPNNLITSVKSGNVNMPRKLVRGQDVWLGRGAEQTRQILKCMWCGQSFKSLADMTQHMKITQHYTNIISQEQIISWRTPEEKMNQSQVNAVLTCKVCDEAFSSLKELSNHMIKNSHFKENGSRENGLSRSGGSTPTPPANSTANNRSNSGRSTTTAVSSDRRKKSLPVRKLLELEREEYRKSGDDDDDSEDVVKPSTPQLIECDDCHDKIEPRCFLQHIKQCRLKNSKSDAESDNCKNESDKVSDELTKQLDINKESFKEDSSGEETKEDEKQMEKSESKDDSKRENAGEEPSSSGSVLSALEKLIEKNFDTKSRRTQQTGILQRLGIDEEVFPPWQNMAPSPLNAMSPSMANWNSMNGVEFSRSNSSSSSNSRINSVPPMMPQLRYRRNSSSASLKDKLFTGLNVSIKATESNGSFSSQETEEDESCDDSNSDCGSGRIRLKKKKTYSASRAQMEKNSRLNFPISSMLSSPIPTRPTSASSTASSISPSEPVTPSQVANEQLHRMTPNSHRSNQEETDDDNEMDSPLVLCKKSFSEEPDKKSKSNGVNEDETDEEINESINKPTHHPLMQLQKLLDKTDNSRHSSVNRNSNNHRTSPYTGWPDPSSIKAMSPSSSPRTPPNVMQHSPSSTSAKSEQDATSYLLLKCAFCDTQIASRASYRSHLAKYHLSMRDSVDLSAISDEELLLLVLAKNSNLPLGNSHGNLLTTASAPSKISRSKESKRKSKANLNNTWDKSPNNITKSSSPSPQLETSQSKFLKYTELAKQLSSKYV